MTQIDVSFDRWKALTALLRDEDDSYDAVIGRLLGGRPDGEQPDWTQGAEYSSSVLHGGLGAYFKEVFLPEGTELRATHKGQTYFARISGSQWIDSKTGEPRTSPSQAAYFITGNNVNGWLFWLVKRPNDREWKSLNALRAGLGDDG